MSVLVIVLEGQLLWIKIYSHILDTDTHIHVHTHTVGSDNYKTGAPVLFISFAGADRTICAGSKIFPPVLSYSGNCIS